MRTKFGLTTWTAILCALLLGGCGEVLNEFYISNHTDMVLTVGLTPLYIETVDLWSGPLIEDMQRSARSSLKQPVGFDQDGETVQFRIPARTTVFLGISSGGNDLFSRLEVTSTDLQLVMERETMTKSILPYTTT